MANKISELYQFKITLNDSKPSIWRRIVVPANYSFWDLHVAIQDSMGWLDYHPHEFEIVNPTTAEKVRIGLPDEEYEDMINWLGGEFDPKLFDPESVIFDNPKKRFELMNGE
jgi:prepilin-type processing-associated H-X9-DG protein